LQSNLLQPETQPVNLSGDNAIIGFTVETPSNGQKSKKQNVNFKNNNMGV